MTMQWKADEGDFRTILGLFTPLVEHSGVRAAHGRLMLSSSTLKWLFPF